MTDVPPGLAVRTVHDGLFSEVLPTVEDAHARATLKAALGILRHVSAALDRDETATAALVADGLARGDAWARAVPAARPHLERARALDPAAARDELLVAAQVTVRQIWREPALRAEPGLLASVRAFGERDLALQGEPRRD